MSNRYRFDNADIVSHRIDVETNLIPHWVLDRTKIKQSDPLEVSQNI